MGRGYERGGRRGGGGAGGFVDDQGSHPWNIGGEALEHVDVLRMCDSYTEVDGHRLRPLEVRECAVGTPLGLKLETAPERRTGYEDRTPMLTDVRGFDQIPFAGAIFENPGQDLWRKLVDGNKCVPNHPNRLQNPREITFDTTDL